MTAKDGWLMVSRTRNHLKAFLLLVALSCTGCPGPGVWYAPHGNGVLVSDFTTLNIKDHLKIDLQTNVFLDVEAVPYGDDTRVMFGLTIPEGSWAQYAADTIRVTRSDNNQTMSIVIEQMDSLMLADQNTRNGTPQPKGGIIFYKHTSITAFRPRQFELEIPALTVDGKLFNIPPITFTVHRGFIMSYKLQ